MDASSTPRDDPFSKQLREHISFKSTASPQASEPPVKESSPSPVEPKPSVSVSSSPSPSSSGSASGLSQNMWMWGTIALVVLTLIILFNPFSGTGGPSAITGDVIAADDAAEKVVNYFNNLDEIAGAGSSVSLVSVEDNGYLYEVLLSYQGQQVPVYVTYDGEYYSPTLVPLGNAPSAPSGNTGTPTQPTVVEVSVDDDAVKGDPDAPVTIVEFSDFECPFCARFYDQTYGQIVDTYVETGQVKLVFRDFPLNFHPNAQKAAEAAECAGEESDEMFFLMHDKIFEDGVSSNMDDYVAYAESIGVDDVDAFEECLTSGAMAEEVQADFAQGQSYGVTGTPAFFINGQLVSGAQPFANFEQIIEAELAAA